MGLLVVGSALMVGSASALYARSTLLNTDQYVTTVEPLASNAAIRSALSTFIVDTVYRNVNVESLAREALPTKAEFLAAPLTVAIRIFSQQVVDRFLASSAFRGLWTQANRLAHRQVVALLEDKSQRVGPVTVRNGAVTVDLSQTIRQAQRRLAAAGLSFVNQVHLTGPRVQYRLISAKILSQARRYTALLNQLTWALPVLAVLAFAAAVLLLPDRRRGLLRVALAFAGAMAFVLVALAVARTLYVDAAGKAVPTAAAGAVFDTILRYLRDGARIGLLVAALTGAVVWLAGPSRVAVRVRQTVRAGLSGAWDRAEALGLRPGPVVAYVAAHRPALRVGVTAAAVAAFLLWPSPTLGAVVELAVLLAVLLAAIEVVGRAGFGERLRGQVPARRPS